MAGNIAVFVVLYTAINVLSAVAMRPAYTLSAATRLSAIQARRQPFELVNTADLIYADGSNPRGVITYAAKCHIESKNPILVLEDVEDWWTTVQCTSTTLKLSKAARTDEKTLQRFHDLVGGHIITSHPGSNCNDKHERRAYKVLAVQEITESTTILSIKPANWRASFDTVDIEFGYSTETHELHHHKGLRRRLAARQSNPYTNQSAIPYLQPTTSNVPQSSNSSYTFDLSFDLNDKTLSVPGNDQDTKFELKCVKCTATGSLDIGFGKFTFSAEDGLEGGNVTATLHGFSSHIELSTKIQDSWSTYVPLLPAVNGTWAIHVPGIGSANLRYDPFLAAGWDMNGSIGFTYGFDTTVPDGAGVYISISGLDAGVEGLEQSTVTALPFQSDAEFQTLGLWLSARTTLAAGFHFDEEVFDVIDDVEHIFDGSDEDDPDGDFGAHATVYIDTPIIFANITPVSNVDENCAPTTNATISKVLNETIKIDISGALNWGLDAESTIGSDREYGPYNGSFYNFSMANQCLNFNRTSGQYVNATEAVQVAERAAQQGFGVRDVPSMPLLLGAMTLLLLTA
ncbi:hypothetical protein AC578_6989 [Pseudocercospora eumusae]|uniref:DUF7029 domain-containing protein n=1 Tax=Pseudocercospora eumusae TaxID=321146 RepID=A0A139GZG4_9PEZI|nr:hypothetical protein AC578_6989 [Pseudocercospora eumusae]